MNLLLELTTPLYVNPKLNVFAPVFETVKKRVTLGKSNRNGALLPDGAIDDVTHGNAED